MWLQDQGVARRFGWVYLIMSQHPTKFWEPWALWMWIYNVFDLSRDHVINVSRDFVGGVSSS